MITLGGRNLKTFFCFLWVTNPAMHFYNRQNRLYKISLSFSLFFHKSQQAALILFFLYYIFFFIKTIFV